MGGATPAGAELNPPPPVCPRALPLPGSLELKPPAKPPDVDEKLKEEAAPNPEPEVVEEEEAAGGAAKEKEAAADEPKPEEDAGADDPNPVLLLLPVGAAKEKEAEVEEEPNPDEGADAPNPPLLLLGEVKLKLLAWTVGAASKPADSQRVQTT